MAQRQLPAHPGSGAFRTAAPPGFVVLASLLACAALEAATLGDRVLGVSPLVARGVLGSVAVLSALSAEALWHQRRWLRRVMAAWAITTPLAAAAWAVAAYAGQGALVAGVRATIAAIFVSLPCLGTLAYVGRRIRPAPPATPGVAPAASAPRIRP